jgi:hypothetical protein
MGLPKVAGDFDFLVGEWDIHNRRREPALGGDDNWYEMQANMVAYTHFNGAVSFDAGWFPSEGFRGATFRLYDTVEKTWSIHWINSIRGILETPVIGAFTPGGPGICEGPDSWEGRPIDVRFRWTPASREQSFSTDQGNTWHPNWHLTHPRTT